MAGGMEELRTLEWQSFAPHMEQLRTPMGSGISAYRKTGGGQTEGRQTISLLPACASLAPERDTASAILSDADCRCSCPLLGHRCVSPCAAQCTIAFLCVDTRCIVAPAPECVPQPAAIRPICRLTCTHVHGPAVMSVLPFLFANTGNVLGGIPFGPTTVELKDADYQRTEINDGNFLSVSLIGDG